VVGARARVALTPLSKSRGLRSKGEGSGDKGEGEKNEDETLSHNL